MPLTLVLGPANSAKAGEVLGAYAAASPRGALLVVPTTLDARHYTRELAASGAVMGSVLTFSGLAREIARRVDYDGRRLSDRQRERVLEVVLARAPFEALADSAGASGFAAAAGALIAELQRGLVTPQRFAAALARWASGDPQREAYARDVARVYGDYARELDRLGRVDRELFAWRALDALRDSPGRWGTDQVFFYGFDELTALERDAVETLSRIAAARVTVSLTYEPGHEALMARAEAVEELRPLADRGPRAARARRALRPRTARRAASPGAVAVRTAGGGSSPDRRSSCSRPAASAPRPSWWPPRCSSCCAPGCPGPRSWSSIAPWAGRRRCCSAAFASTGSR